MNPLPIVIFAFLIGFIEWFLAMRRSVAVINRESLLTFILVLVEGILAWSVLSSFQSVDSYPFESSVNFESYNMLSNIIFFIWEWCKAYRWKILTVLSTSIGGALGALVVANRKQ